MKSVVPVEDEVVVGYVVGYVVRDSVFQPIENKQYRRAYI